jgi:hypothetical protein
VRRFLAALSSLAVAAVGCGDGGGGGTNAGGNSIALPNDTNVAAIVVDAGPLGASGRPVGYVNGAFVTVTVCVPGTSNCQSIDHVLVDTGSSGLRMLANDGTAGGQLALQLPQLRDGAGNAIAECTQFLDGFTWGQVQLADVRIAGEKANGVAVQVISEATYPVPSACAGVGVNEDTLEGSSGLGTNGILGVGLFREDCGPACAMDPAAPGSANPGVYYACSSTASGGCAATAVAARAQVSNPVAMFATDNNGVIVELPLVGPSGAPTVNGSLVFGIGTQSNNGLGNATVFPVDGGGSFVTVFPPKGTGYAGSFIDSGSNGIFFLDSQTTGIPLCPGGGGMTGFYCPANAANLSATNEGAGGSPMAQVNFSIANAKALFDTGNVAFGNLGGPSGGTPAQQVPSAFDWGLSFFFGRNVFTAIEGAATARGMGPYFAY